MQFKFAGKRLTDFKDHTGHQMFNERQLARTVIVDDQYAAIAPESKDHLILTKKFVKHMDNLRSKVKQVDLRQYQLPLNSKDIKKPFQVLQNVNNTSPCLTNDGRQLTDISMFITRVFMIKFMN